MKLIKCIWLTGLLVCCGNGFAQAQTLEQAQRAKFKNQYAVGANYLPEWQIGDVDSSNGRYHTVLGVSGEAQFSRHSGLEFFVGYRHYCDGAELSHHTKRYRFTSLRLAYKFYSNIVNVKMGMMYDFGAEKSYFRGDILGANLTVSKDIMLTKGLILEPEIRYAFAVDGITKDLRGNLAGANPLSLLGAGLKLKYRF